MKISENADYREVCKRLGSKAVFQKIDISGLKKCMDALRAKEKRFMRTFTAKG